MKLTKTLTALASVASVATIAQAKSSATDCAAGADVQNSATSANTGSVSSGADSGLASLSVVAPTVACADLAKVDVTDIGGTGSTIASATETTSGNVTYCAVNGVLNTNVSYSVLLPKATWTQRFLFSGCGGLCGMNSVARGSPDSTGQFVVAGNDMAGGNDGTFGLVRDRRVNFAYRANHWVTLAAKKLIKAYYGQEQKYSYFSGCSDGGREAVMEALRYPDDFDGIVAGAPAFIFQLQNTLHHGWLAVSNTAADGTHPLIGSRLSVLHNAVINACDALDGLKDGLLSDPRLCQFDPKTIQCAAGATNTTACLTAAEVETIAKIYQGPVDTKTGQHLTVGEAQFGSELSWQGVFVPPSSNGSIMSESTSLSVLKYLAFEQPMPNFTLKDLEFSVATVDKLKARHPLFNAISSDLSAFKQAGGKLILYHGWSDPHISPRGTIAFHEALQKHMGQAAVESFERLYLLPGVYHCGDGDGFSTFDFLTPMQKWVESKTAPDAVVVSSGSGSSVKRSRPLYPYPFVAKYSGSGDANDASSYTKGSALYTKLTQPWAAESWFEPYKPLEG